MGKFGTNHSAVMWHLPYVYFHSTLGFMQTPSWINEGYCEYISYQYIRKNDHYDLSDLYLKYQNTKDSWVQTEYKSMTPKIYLRDRIIMEYLLDIKKRNILEIINDESLRPEDILAEINSRYSRNALPKSD